MKDSISSKLCGVRVCVWAAWFSGTCTELDTVGSLQMCLDMWLLRSVEAGVVKVVVQETPWILMTLVGDLLSVLYGTSNFK